MDVPEEASAAPKEDGAPSEERALLASVSSRSTSGKSPVSTLHAASQEQLLASATEEHGDRHSYNSDPISEWRSADLQQQDIRRASSTTSRLPGKKTTRYQKLLVVGDGGSGRTTALQTLFAAAGRVEDQTFKDVHRADSLYTFKFNPSAMCTEVVAESEDDGSVTHHSIQETPGLHLPGAQAAIVAHVKAQLRQWFQTDQDPDRKTPLDGMSDPRIDACLYFILPGALRPQDISFMQALSTVVPVIPILAKADAMTDEEREAFREHVAEELKTAAEECGHPVMHEFPAAELEAAGAETRVLPFAVMGSTTPDLSVGRHWFVREYQWGKAPVLSSATSDVLQLRDLLLSFSVDSLKSATKRRYLTFRHEMLDPRPSRRRTATIAAEAPITGRSNRARRQDVRPAGNGSKIMAAVVMSMLLLPAMGCLFYWGKANRLQHALDAQRKDNSLREQAFQDLQRQHVGPACPLPLPHASLSDKLVRTYSRTKALTEAASASLASKTEAFFQRWLERRQRRDAALEDFMSSSMDSLNTAAMRIRHASADAGQAIKQALSKGADSVSNVTVSAVRSPAWRKMRVRLHQAHQALSRTAKEVEVGFHRQSHTMAKRSAKRIHHTRKAARSAMTRLAQWRCRMAANLNSWAASTTDKLSTHLPKRARFTRFMQRAVGFYGGWLGARFQ